MNDIVTFMIIRHYSSPFEYDIYTNHPMARHLNTENVSQRNVVDKMYEIATIVNNILKLGCDFCVE
jgi:hypothetical protein